MALEEDLNFDFLPQLPKDNLDDRTFEDLVAECLLRIPRYCPEWTDYNPSDPGITLIELFAWLTDQMLLRFNKIPRRNYITFLQLLGIRLQPPASARTELTFYLNQSAFYRIPKGTEVGTKRSEIEEAIIFTTDKDLVIAQPSILYFLTAETIEESPQLLRDGISNQWTRETDGSWNGNEQTLFNERPEPGNCFYLVCNSQQPLDGNVIAINFKGMAATPTGIDPNNPPRKWEAWDGKQWQSVLLSEKDDYTQGFSFQENQSTLDSLQSADVILHLPLEFPVKNFIGYEGSWLRCIYMTPETNQLGYINTPRITGLNIKSIGGTVSASNNILIENELLGISDGTPGQTFTLQAKPVLSRLPEEHILVIPPDLAPQTWQEVNDFADSTHESKHYTLDSLTGIVQFGPLIQESSFQVRETEMRAHVSSIPALGDYTTRTIANLQGNLEHQYGSIPPRGAEIRIRSYRYGGGRKGNVDKETLNVLKSALPYVTKVTNYQGARGGADPESLHQAVLRAPKSLRSRDRAVTKEDFETLTLQGGKGAIARCLCLTPNSDDEAGIITILAIPQVNKTLINSPEGLAPELFQLPYTLREETLTYLNERKLLGVQLRLVEPKYTGVVVELTEIGLEPIYNNPQARTLIKSRLENELYSFLNPITGGNDKKGWQFSRPVYVSDIIALFQSIPEVRYLGPVILYEVRKIQENWTCLPEPLQMVDPGTNGLICSWKNRSLGTNHRLNIREN